MAKIIQKSNNSIENNYIICELQPILKKLENKTIIQIFDDSLNEINEIFHIISKIRPYKSLNQISNINHIINLEFIYLKQSISQKNIKYLFIFFILNNMVKIRFEDFQGFIDLTPDEITKLQELIYSFLKNSYFFHDKQHALDNMKICSNFTSTVIKKWLESYYFNTKAKHSIKFSEKTILTIVNNKISYSEIKWSEFNGYQYELIHNLKWTLINLNFNKFVRLINDKNDIKEIIILLDKLNLTEINKISNENLTNKWAVFELLHIICLNSNNNNVELIEKLLTELYDNDYDFFINAKSHFLNNNLFNKAYINLLFKLPENQMKKLWLSFEFNNFNNLPKNNLYQNLINKTDKNKIKTIIKLTFKKYNEHIEQNEDNNNHPNFFITDYWKFICYYYCHFIGEEKIIEELTSTLHDIKYIDSYWFLNKTKMKKENYAKLTKLYFLSFAYATNTLKNNYIPHIIDEIFNNTLYCKRILEFNDFKYISKIKQNIFQN